MATRRTDADGRVSLELVSRRLLDRIKVISTSHGVQTFSDFKEVLKHGAVTSIEGELSTHQAGVRLSLSTHQRYEQIGSLDSVPTSKSSRMHKASSRSHNSPLVRTKSALTNSTARSS